MTSLWASREKSLQKWEATRAKGKWRFILGKGVLLWGGSMFIVMGLIYPRIVHLPSAYTPRGLAISLAIWLLGGLLWGVLMWLTMEWIYRRQTSARGSNAR